MQRFYFALCFVVSLAAQTSSANYLHLLLKARAFDFENFVKSIEELEDAEETLSELDEDDLTVFGRAIVERRQDAIEYLLELECDDVGPAGKDHKTLADFSRQTLSPDIYVFLFNYENARQNEYSLGTSINIGRQKLKEFRAKVKTPTSSSAICKAIEPFRWPPLYGRQPETVRNLNRVIEETCGSASRSEHYL